MATPTPRIRISTACPEDSTTESDWSVVLAGSDNPMVASYVLSRLGERVPKVYLRLAGARSMLEQTLDRLLPLTPASRTVTVVGPHRLDLALAQVAGRSDYVLRQPLAVDTGFGLYLALAMIRRWAPDAIVTVVPGDHHVAPESEYLEELGVARRLARLLRDRVVVLGAVPSGPDGDADYLVVGEPVAELPRIGRLDALVRRPSLASARELTRRGALWSMSSACASVDALWELGRAAEPRLLGVLDSLIPLIGTDDEDDAIDFIYRAFLPISFARDMIARAPSRCVVMPLHGVAWSDVGTAAKLEALLACDAR